MLLYVITNTVNGKRYVGQTTKTLAARWRQHRQLQGKCRALESAILKYGADAFTARAVCAASTQDELNDLEAAACEIFGTYAPGGYNLKGGGGARGPMHEETKAIMRRNGLAPARIAALRAMATDPEVQAKLQVHRIANGAKAAKAMHAAITPATRLKAAATLRRTMADPAAKARIAAAQQAGRTPETALKRSASLKASWAGLSDAERAARAAASSAGARGVPKTLTDAQRQTLADAARERFHTPEAHAKKAAGLKAAWANLTPEERAARGAAISAGKARRKAST